MAESYASSKDGGVFDILGMLRRRKIVIALPILLGAATGWVATRNQIATYQASAVVMVDTRKIEVININSVMSHLPQDNTVLRSELDLISSRLLAGRIVDRLDLMHDPHLLAERTQAPPWAAALHDLQAVLADRVPEGGRLLAAVLPEPAAALAAPTRDQAIDHVLAGLRVSNDGRSYTIIISFSSPDPSYATLVANSVAEQYLVLQTEMKSIATRQANAWLSQRLGELRQSLEASEQAVEEYRQKEGLFETEGKLIDTNRLAALIQRRDEARLRRLEAEARLASAQALISRGPAAGDVSETAGSEILRGLRQQEIELRRRIADLASRANDRHPAMIALNNDLAVLRQRAREEEARTVKTLSNEVEITRTQEANLEEALSGLKENQGRTGNGTLVLRQLVREAEANRAIYEVVLNRYKETAEQIDLQRPDASIISPAAMPTEPVPSRRLPVIVIGGIGGALLGVLLALLRERRDQPVRSIPDLERATGIPVIGLVPDLGRLWRRGWLQHPEDSIGQGTGGALRDALCVTQIAIRPQAPGRSRTIAARPQVLLVTSALAHEGKTTFCISMARMLAMDGKRVMLIDADLRRPRVGSALGAGKAGAGLVDLLTGNRPLEEAVAVDAKTGLHYLSAHRCLDNPQAALAGEAFQQLIRDGSRLYDVIIIDTPPVMVAPDAAVVAPLADACVFMARWGRTPVESVLAGLRLLHLCRVAVSGIVLNRVCQTRHSAYAPYRGQDIYPPLRPAASQIDG
ncbi:GumC family protein [Azospirillum picis]|uniref:non-specific protein-tyrosine kinase n=1 Tax=Azospirillum picis TaxID=488438 RepID=A0ABU0MRM5_9PROT|nr:polysaccharide biosynthesis tyrosine autokinase [Azospirillum picis]MBP2300868.1 capsular exopolysaccharide synthesis family protein [Azospirillum picis]MDQ0536125.1 capsular exopolysaccharide synthesis family protein [Azospirillum picis]